MANTRFVEAEVEGVLVGSKYSAGLSNIEISPNTSVRIVKEGNHTTTFLDNYDHKDSHRITVPFQVPEDYARVRFTKTRENDQKEDKKGFSLVSYVTIALENLKTGYKQECRFADFAEEGRFTHQKSLEGTLEKLPDETIQNKIRGIKDSYPVTVVGIRSYNGKSLTPVIVYGLSESMEEAYGHKCKLNERIVNLSGQRLGSFSELQQNITDLETGKVYKAGNSLNAFSPRQVAKWKACAKQIQ